MKGGREGGRVGEKGVFSLQAQPVADGGGFEDAENLEGLRRKEGGREGGRKR